MKTTVDIYNNIERFLEQKAVIFFSKTKQLEVTKDNYLVSSFLLEEAHGADNLPFGSVTSNELTLQLYNENDVFTPTNKKSIYYGLMKKGIKVELYIRPVVDEGTEEYDWDPLGTFYVTDWKASITNTTATIIFNDIMYELFKKDIKDMPVQLNITQQAFYERIFKKLDIPANIDNTLKEVLTYAYVDKNTKEVLTELNMSSLSDCFCNHVGEIIIKSINNINDPPILITDENQIISANIEQSLTYDYDGINLKYNLPQESQIQNILELKGVSIARGITSLNNVTLTGAPLFKLCASILNNEVCEIDSIEASTHIANITFNNKGDDTVICDLTLLGTLLQNNEVTIGLESPTSYNITNLYIQSKKHAQKIYDKLKAYISNMLPVLELEIRGNPKFELGSIITAKSNKYKLEYTGILIKQTFEYDGSLKSNITLLDINIMKGA